MAGERVAKGAGVHIPQPNHVILTVQYMPTGERLSIRTESHATDKPDIAGRSAKRFQGCASGYIPQPNVPAPTRQHLPIRTETQT